MAGSASADRVRVVRPRRRPHPGCALTDLDRRLLNVMCSHRVVRQDQFERLFPEVAQRTLRYRTRRLHEHGLAGRSRPYRERGSSPNHHWPTRRADGVVRGEPVPRGGDRGEPNPVFLAHAAALTELFVVLKIGEQLVLSDFYREPREPFSDTRRERTLAPDALVVFVNEREETSFAFVELDLGTMSHTRLHAKAEMYASFAASSVWRDRYDFLPALVFLTTSESRTRRFLHVLRAVIDQKKRQYTPIRLAAAAGPIALAPGRMLDEACMTHIDGETPVTLIDILNEARAPFDRERRAAEKRRQAKERKRTQIREHPLIVRRLLRRERIGTTGYLEQLDQVGRTAVEIAIASSDDHLLADEHSVLTVVGHELEDVLLEPGFRRSPTPTATAVQAIADLVRCYRSAQRRAIEALAARYGEGLGLRRALATLQEGDLLDASTADALADRARSDYEAMVEQQQRRGAYEQWREHAAGERVKQTGLLKQLAHCREEFYAEIDAEQLWVCSRCNEVVYPKLNTTSTEPTKTPCHYCTRPTRHAPTSHADIYSSAHPREEECL
jgi:hypothetical protein